MVACKRGLGSGPLSFSSSPAGALAQAGTPLTPEKEEPLAFNIQPPTFNLLSYICYYYFSHYGI